ncbi:MAG: hypothetical protein ABI462_07475 [Ignavibacteria bacterium]
MKTLIFFLIVSICSVCNSQTGCMPAGEYIAGIYNKYNIIALAEGPHGTLNTHKFLRELLKDNTISNSVEYVILEFANISQQEILDRYIKGEKVPFEELQLIWRTATQSHGPLFESPVYFKLLETIRVINFTLPEGKKMRVLAGDPLIDWPNINTQKEFFANLSRRDVLPSELAITYGIDSGKKVLLIYGDAHIMKSSDEKKDSTHWTIPYYINKKYPNSIYTIDMLVSGNYGAEINLSEIPENSICDLSVSPVGMLPFRNNFDPSDTLLMLKDVFDASAYIGPSEKWEADKPALIDQEYWTELNRRSTIIWGEGIDMSLMK